MKFFLQKLKSCFVMLQSSAILYKEHSGKSKETAKHGKLKLIVKG